MPMSFFVTPTRRALYVRAGGSFTIALIFGVAAFVYAKDSLGLILGLVMASCVALIGLFQLWLASRTSPAATVTTIPQLAPVPEQIRYFRRALWLMAFCVPIASGKIAYDLYQLETGAEKSVRVWAPLVPVYEHLGYWPTVAVMPVLGTIVCVVLVVILRQLNSQTTA
jgi:hypothetical protein